MVDLGTNFIYDAVDKDLEDGIYTRVQTRFPPEPNGYLHIGHAKAISIDFATAEKYNGTCNLRLDDTNPTKEDTEYVDAIKEDIEWLGFKWDNVFYASDYFDVIYKCAVELIKQGKAYVCDLNADQIREYRGTLTEPGRESPYRNRSVEENLDLFTRMTNGEFEEGEKVLRAKIDMASPNLNMRDPVIYRILKAHHHRTGDKWCVYPMYDFAHPISDTAEGVTHSLCSLEFENHRPLYDWVLREVGLFDQPSRQIEFARLNLNYTLTSKRKCLKLVNEGIVSGWDDPRMSTICGMRRRGFPPQAILDFVSRIGVAKANSVVDFALLEHCVRDNLNTNAPRAMAVLRPLKVVIDNYPDGVTEELMVQTSPDDPQVKAPIIFSKEIYIEREDFMEEPEKKFFRLAPGKEVRLRGAYFVTCTGCEKDENGNVTVVHCTYDPETRGGNAPDGRKVKGTLHWVSAAHCVPATVRLYERLFNVSNPSDEEGVSSFADNLNPESLTVLDGCMLEADMVNAKIGDRFQFMRQGYFCVDKDSTPENIVINRTVALKDSFKAR